LHIHSITSLPDRIFSYSDAETIILNATKGARTASVFVTKFREVRDADRVTFRSRQKVSWEDEVSQAFFDDVMKGRMIVPALRELWEYLSGSERFGSIANTHIGVQYTPGIHGSKLISTISREGMRRGLANVHTDFMQYTLGKLSYMATDKRYRRRNAWEYDWDAPKVVVPAARVSRGPWRFAAVIDHKGLIVSRRFYAVWPKSPESFPVEVLAALLNSPLAAAHVYAHSFQSLITKRNYDEIPVPPLSDLMSAAPAIKGAVDSYIVATKNLQIDSAQLRRQLMLIDAEVLKLYDLPSFLERRLLDLFWGEKRKVPFEFDGFIPPEYESWIPLHVYISDDYQSATAARIFERLPELRDEAVIEHMSTIGREDASWSS
jgi:hypothetical protein